MLVFLMYIKTTWNDYFEGSQSVILQHQHYSSKQTPTDTNVHVSNCLFAFFTSSNSGGALFCSTSVTCLLVESSSFFSCKTISGSGGAIYFTNTDSGQSVFYKVCGFDCCSSSNCQFSVVETCNFLTKKNYINFSSFSRCVSESSNSYYILFHKNGKNLYPSVNVSMNKCYCRGIYCCPYLDSNSVTFSTSFSSFVDNIAIASTCIMLWMNGAKFEIKSCNILRNTQYSLYSEGTIYTNGITNIEDSCILENIAKYIFFQKSSSYTITVSNCTVDSTSSSGNFVIQNTVTKSFILALNHMSTQNCFSEYDSARTPTLIIPSSHTESTEISTETSTETSTEISTETSTEILTETSTEIPTERSTETPDPTWDGQWDDEPRVIILYVDAPVIRETHYPLQTEYVKTSVSSVTTAANISAGTVSIAVVIVISVYNYIHSAKRLKRLLNNGKYVIDIDSDEFLSRSYSNEESNSQFNI
jgi:hypothetical protein